MSLDAIEPRLRTSALMCFISELGMEGRATLRRLTEVLNRSRRQVERLISRLCRAGLAEKLVEGEVVPFGDISEGAHTEAEYRLVSRWAA